MDSLMATLLDVLLLGIGKAALWSLKKIGAPVPELGQGSTTVLGSLILVATITLIVIAIKQL